MSGFVSLTLEYAKDHPLVTLLVVVFAMRLFSRSQPFPHDESWQVTEIVDLDGWFAMFKATGGGEILVVDFYATWCPPCKAAAPHYGEMSKVR